MTDHWFIRSLRGAVAPITQHKGRQSASGAPDPDDGPGITNATSADENPYNKARRELREAYRRAVRLKDRLSPWWKAP
jgi:hypothetical protein